MPRHRSHSVEFKRQVVAEYHAGECLHALARRHERSRNLIRIWVEEAEAGTLDQDISSTQLLTACEARIAARFWSGLRSLPPPAPIVHPRLELPAVLLHKRAVAPFCLRRRSKS